MAQADRLGLKVGGHLAPCCAHRVNQGELSQCFKHDDSTINIVLVLLLSTSRRRHQLQAATMFLDGVPVSSVESVRDLQMTLVFMSRQ